MKISVPFTKLKSIVHIADVHIRLFRRHEEYESAFERLYQDIRDRQQSGLEDFIIFLGGDIVHAKTDMSPEMVEVTSRFLARIADIAPTLLIAGNHDCNLANTSRLDALTPIVNNLNHKNLYYVRNSDIVTVADTQFAVCSIFDEQENWPSASELDADTKIALYHGPVHGALTDASFTITNRHVHLDTFKGFDMVLLGDIHKHQTLQEYDLKKKKPIIVYSSSLIQQNHGETLENHGWCLWDVPARTFEFVPLENEYGYCTLEVVNGKLQYPAKLPNNVRMRLFTGDLDNTQVKKLITTLRSKYNIIELSVNKSRMTKSVGVNVMPHHDTLNLTDVSVQNSLITDWLTRHFPSIDTEVATAIEKINKDLNSKVQHDDQSRNVHWRPLNFKFSNMFSYGENNEINFSDMKGLYGIFASNASGKSSVMDSLMFCLYDKTPRAFKGDHIINNRKDKFECELLFEINNEVYGIKRNGTRKKNGDVKVDVQFWKVLDNGDTVSLNGEDRRDTNANIRNYVGSYEDFVMTALSSQTSNALFIDKSHSERKDLLIQFMGLNIFDKLFDAANDEAKEIIGILKRFKKSDVTDAISSTHDQLTEALQNSADVEAELDGVREEKELLDDVLVSTQLLKRTVPETSGNKIQLEKNLVKTNESLKDALSSLEDIKGKKFAVQIELDEKKLNLSHFDLNDLKAAVDSYNKYAQSLQKETSTLKVLATKIEEKEKFKAKLSGYKYNPNCEVCVENNKSVIQDLDHVETEIHDLEEKYLSQRDVVITIQTEMDSLIDKKNEYDVAIKIQFEIEKCEQVILSLRSKEDTLKLSVEKLTNQISKIEQDISVYTQNEEAIIYNQKIDEDIVHIQSKIAEKKKVIQQLDQKIRSLHGTISVLKNKKQELLDKLKEAEQLEVMYEAYTHYLLVVGRDGVPYELMSKAIPQIEAEINSILSQIVEFTVSLEVDGKNINGKLTYDYDRIWPLENSSGMERFVSSLAIRVALMNASNLPKSNFLIIDEGFGVLDAEHLHSMQTLFNLLKTHFDFILIVSHLETARDMVDNLIEIKKEDGYSQISV
jgi:DNA repair exonuclease SbcCD ATPase subunit